MIQKVSITHLDETQVAALKAMVAGPAPSPNDAALLMPFLAQAVLDLNQSVLDLLKGLQGAVKTGSTFS